MLCSQGKKDKKRKGGREVGGREEMSEERKDEK
jgi:hypothetical protein